MSLKPEILLFGILNVRNFDFQDLDIRDYVIRDFEFRDFDLDTNLSRIRNEQHFAQ